MARPQFLGLFTIVVVCWSGQYVDGQVVDCGSLTDPANGQVDLTSGTTFGQTATYSCNTGYNLVGDSTRTCQATGEWSGSAPTCQVVDCGSLTDPANGQVNLTAGTTFGQTATYSCNTGYNLVGDSTRTCQATGEWSGSAPTCEAADCGSLTDPANGQVDLTSGTTFGQTATYSCNTGYNLVGNSTRMCEANGMWSGNTPVCSMYNLVGDSTQTCQALGDWSGSSPSCELVDCGNLTNPTNGQVSHSAGTTFGQTATYSCNTGYNLMGDSTHACQATGEWSGSAPNCEAVDCDPLTPPPSGQVNTTGTTFGETANYSCNTGYNLIGNSTRMCEANGMWSGNTPFCSNLGVWFSLNGTIYLNNSFVTLDNIGEGDAALFCHTDQPRCCRRPHSNARGNWFFPNGTRVPSSGNNWDFHRTRGQMAVLLHKRRNGVKGVYRCEIPDELDIVKSIYIGVYTEGTVAPPDITTQPTSQQNVVPGTTITFMVQATGGGLTYLWQRNGETLSDDTKYSGTTTATLTVMNVMEEDEGNFTCAVTNDLGGVTSDAAELSVLDPPMIIEQPRDMLNVTPGTNATFTVVASGLRLTYTWMKGDGNPLSNRGYVIVNGTLTVPIVSRSDNGSFRCLVSNPAGNATSQSAELTLGLGEVGFTFKGVTLNNNSLVTLDDIGEGEDALRCMTDNISCCRPPYARSATGNWFFPNGTRVPSSGGQWDFHRTRGDMTVFLHKRRGGVDGVFYCVVPDKEGIQQTTYIGVYTAGTGQVTIADEITFQLDTDLATDPPVFILTCTSTGGPPSTVTWSRDGTPLSDNNTYRIASQVINSTAATYTHSLTVTGRLEGQYMFNVSNIRTPSASTSSVTVVAADSPTDLNVVQVNLTSIRVSWTQPATVTGYQVYWSGDGGADSGDIIVGAGDTDVTITGRTPGLTYDITIVALSDQLPGPPAKATITLVAPPDITTQPTSQLNVVPGTNVSFMVEAKGSDLTYQWQRNGVNLTDDTKYSGTTSATLTVMNVMEEDEGNFTCVVTNVGDSVTSSAAQLTVLDPPMIIEQPRDMLNVAPGTNATFTVVASGLRLTYTWMKGNGDPLSNDRVYVVVNGTLTIPIVSRLDNGSFRCLVSNPAGNDTSQSAELTVGLGEVGFTFKGAALSNNSLVTLDDIGEGEDALRCMTDNISCCRPPYTQNLGRSALGNWFFPNGTRVPSSGSQWDFHRTRGDMMVLLHKRRGGVNGVFYCVLPDKEGIQQTTYIGVYTGNVGQVTIADEITFQLDTDPATDPPVFTLTCTSTGGPPSTVTWSRDGTPLSDNSTYRIASQVINSTTATYTHTLTVTGRLEGVYVFNVSNIRTPSASTSSLTVVVNPPMIIGQPRDMFNVTPGTNATFTVVASGLRLTYTWMKGDGNPLSSDRVYVAVNGTLTIPSVSRSDNGSFRCLVSNPAGNVTSQSADLTLSLGEVGFTFKGATLSNNSLVTLDDIGEGDDALRCMTDNISCCRPPYTRNLSQSALGNWFFPNGTRVPSSGAQWDFHRTRGDMTVLLHKRRGGEDGVFHCVVPDKEGIPQTTYIGVYTAGTGSPIVTSLTFNSSTNTLTCTSTGGPPTNVTWRRDGVVITPNVTHQQTQMLTNQTTSTYQTVLTINSSVSHSDIAGTYNCTVENVRGGSSETVVVAGLEFTFRQPVYMFLESITVGRVCIDKLTPTNETVRIMISGDLQQGSIDQNLTITPEENETCVDVFISNNDIALEDVEMLRFTLSNIDDEPIILFTPFSTTNVGIVDDDELLLSLVKTTTNIPENIGTTDVCVKFSHQFLNPFQIIAQSMVPSNFNMTGITAGTPDVDYVAINQTINVTSVDSAAGETCFNLSVLDDTVLEEPLECLLLTIQLPEDSPDMLHIAPGNDSTLCCIMDDDSDHPDITTQPMSQLNVVPGTNVSFMVEAKGSDLTYQWQRNGVNLTDDTKYSGTTSATLTVMNVVKEDEGNFTCVVTNVVGSVTSSAAQLTVLIVDCGALSDPANGQVTTTETTFGQTATYSCNTGYNLVGDSTRMCQATANWSGSAPMCEPVDCGPLPNPANGQVNTTGTTFGQTATYSCNTGYNLIGDSGRTCQATGNWFGSAPTCQIVDCGSLTNPSNGQVTHTSGTTFGQTATYSCNTGYNLVGNSTRTCQATGNWFGSAPTCQIVDCGSLTNPANGQVDLTSGTTFGQIATYSCDTGYNLVGNSTRTCQATETWSGSAPACQIVDCGALSDPANGQVNTTGTTFEQTATYSCNTGYNLVGDSTRTCQATGNWSGSAPTCQSQIVDCGSLTNPANGQVDLTSGTTFGQIATYSCNTGYNLLGDSTRTCQATETWSGSAPMCEPVDCGALPQPVFGQVDHTEGTTFGQTAIYYCDFGNPIGNSTRTCQATGNWTGSQPTCPLSTPPADPEPEVSFSLNGTTYQNNSLVTLEDIGEGDAALLCLTEATDCCRPPYNGTTGVVIGNWFFPNGSRVPSSGAQWDFYSTRGEMELSLHRRRGGEDGVYRCEIPDASNVTQSIYIGVYTENIGSPSVTSVTFNAQSNSFTCISSGGSARTVTWRRNGIVIPRNDAQQTQRVMNTTTSTYQSVLTIDTSVNQNAILGTFSCTVQNARGTSSRMVVVTDVMFTFRQQMYMFMESVGMGKVCIDKLNSTSETIQIMISGDLQQGSIDQTVTFTPQDNESCVDFLIYDDDLALEPTETLRFTLSNLDNGSHVFGLYNTTYVGIMDDDELLLSLVKTTNNIPENTGTTDVCVKFSHHFLQPFQINAQSMVPSEFNMTGVMAGTPNVDYVAIDQTINVTLMDSAAGETCFDLLVLDDTVLEEPLECLVLRIQLPEDSPDMLRIAPGNDSTLCCIMDDDNVTIGFTPMAYQVNEADGRVELNVSMTTGISQRAVSLLFTLTNGTAFSPDDFVNTLGIVLQFNGVFRSQPVIIMIENDDILENDETFFGNLEAIDQGVIVAPQRAAITIVEDNADRVTIGFDPTEYTVAESGGAVTLIVVLREGSLQRNVTINFETSRATATSTPPADYELVITSITFGPGMLQQRVIVPIYDDNILEEEIEIFFAHLVNDIGDPVDISPDVAAVIIQDEGDNVTIGFEQTTYNITEGVKAEAFVVVESPILEKVVMVTVFSSDGTATADDYIPINETLTFSSTVRRQAVNLTALVDPVALETEAFSLGLRSTERNVALATSTTTINVAESPDTPSVVNVRFVQPEYTFNENSGPATVCLTKDLETGVEISVLVFTINGSALDGEDFIGGIFPVTLGRQVDAQQCVSITILPDSIRERREHFNISIQVPANLSQVQTGYPATATVVIDDAAIEVNDTVIGDPLLTVPVLVQASDLAQLGAERLSLCYEIHGRPREYFNFVTDDCASVNAHYIDITDHLNVIDRVGIRAVESGDARQCRNISVDLNGCSAMIDGRPLNQSVRYNFRGIRVRQYPRRVRVAVPNCNDLSLVIWVICQNNTLDDHVNGGKITAEMIKIAVMRGLNFGHRNAHGLLGQFWNVPVRVSPYTGEIGWNTSEVYYVVNATRPGTNKVASFTGFIFDYTWESEEGPCLYVGDRQGGADREIQDPNDRVLDGSSYKDYIVPELFSESGYKFSRFDDSQCN